MAVFIIIIIDVKDVCTSISSGMKADHVLGFLQASSHENADNKESYK